LQQIFCAATITLRVHTLAELTGIAPARVAAAHVLLAVERGVAHSDDQLRSPRVEALSRQDRDLTTELVRGTLRWQLVLDREIAARLRYPESDMHFGVIIALRLGVYQLLFLDRIPAHAAINESVELAKQADGAQMAGLTNAVLRRILREREQLRAVRTQFTSAYPAWLLSKWRARFGNSAADSICAYGQEPSPTYVRVTDTDGPDGEGLQAGAFLARARRVLKVEPTNLRIQDEASQLVGELAALDAGGDILDACAAPGGKTAILAERNPDSSITAMDVSAPRLRIMQRRLPWSDRLRFQPGDASALLPGAVYSGILCDMPCSGSGTLGRNPEIRHRLNEAGIARQAERQRAILLAALKALKPGGRLVYSTCSLEVEENEQVVEAILGIYPKATLQPIGPLLERLSATGIVTDAGKAALTESALTGRYLRTVPGIHPCDGFFAAVLTVAL
jgi:16S rRNA (cytosine967-C5)-methyltransferase